MPIETITTKDLLALCEHMDSLPQPSKMDDYEKGVLALDGAVISPRGRLAALIHCAETLKEASAALNRWLESKDTEGVSVQEICIGMDFVIAKLLTTGIEVSNGN